MNPRTEERLEKVKRMSRSARRVCFLLMALTALAALGVTAGRLNAPEMFTCEIGGVRQACGELPPEAVTFTVVGVIGGLVLLWVALYRLARLFQNYSRGEIFTRGSAREIRVLGYVAAAYAIFQVTMVVAMLALAANGGSDWPRELRLDFSLGPFVIAFFVLLFSWVMDVGAEMREENELTV
jgi:hypothetical protein